MRDGLISMAVIVRKVAIFDADQVPIIIPRFLLGVKLTRDQGFITSVAPPSHYPAN